MNIQWGRRKYSETEFTNAWLGSLSIAQVAEKLNCNKTGGGYTTLRDTAKHLGLSKDHMTGQAWNKGVRRKSTAKSRPLEDILIANSPHRSTYSLKLRLFSAGLKQKQCEECGLTEWQGKPAPLALDHINGINNDHRIENLQILCYNCHGQTSTFGTRNRGAYN